MRRPATGYQTSDSQYQEVREALESQQHLSLRDYGRVVMKRWKLVTSFAILGMAVGLFSYFTSAKAFKATSEVLIQRQSGYSILSAGSSGLGAGLNLGTSTSTKQQQHFLETDSYQQTARALADIAQRIHLDLQDSATLDDISTIIQSDVLNSEYVTPVRIALYDLPAPSLLSFQQAKTIREAPALRASLDNLAKMSQIGIPSLTAGFEPGRPGPNDRKVRDNMRLLANSNLVTALQSIGVTQTAAEETIPSAEEQYSSDLGTFTRVVLAAKAIDILSDLDEVGGTAKARGGKNITEEKTSPDILKDAQAIMTSRFTATLKSGPGNLDWLKLTPADKLAAIQKAGEALNTWHGKHKSKEDLVWDVSGKEVGDGTDIIAVTQTAPTDELARTAANSMAAVMVWQDRMTKVASDERSIRFLTAQIGNDRSGATKILRMREDELTAYRKASHMLDPETQLRSAAQEAASLESDQGKARVEISDAQASLQKVLQQLGISEQFVKAPTIKLNPLVESIKSDLIRAETELAGLRAQGFTEEWPAVMNAKARLQNLQYRLNNEVRESIERQYTPDPVHYALAGKAADLAATIVGLQARRTALGRLLGEMDGRFSKLPDNQAELLRYMRAEALAEQQYNYLYVRLIDAQNNRVIRQGDARVVSVATGPSIKAAPRIRNIIVAIFLGLFFGSLCALMLSGMDTHLRTIEDVHRELKLPVLAHLPKITAGDMLVVESMPTSAITEAFRSLRSTIRFAGGDTPPKSIVATSAQMSEAKTAVVANLAASLAQAGLSVTAVDADLRRPRLASYFGSAASSGLAEALSSGRPVREAKQAARIPGLYIIPAGSAAGGASELLENGRIAAAIADLAETSDLVLIDTPPIGAVTDAAVVGSAADAIILVIESGRVGPDEARNAVAKLTQSAKANLLGIVLVGGDAPASTEYQRYASAAGVNGAQRGPSRS